MVVFGGLGPLDIVRSILVLATAGFLPGLFIYAARHKAKDIVALFWQEPVELIAFSVTISMILLALASALLAFTIGFGVITILVLELIIIAGAWWLWKRK